MEFIGIIGERGSGKSNLLTRYLKRAAESGQPVVSNYRLIGIKHRLMSFEEIRSIVSDKRQIELYNRKDKSSRLYELYGSILGLDELGIGADSYDFFSKDSRDIVSLIAQIRKLHCICYYTVQRMRQIARRLRLQTNGFIFMEDLDKGKMHYPNGRLAENHRAVCDGMFRAEFRNDDMELINEQYFNGKPYWGMYDTDEMIWA